jgi:hypothetical protein
MIKSILLWATVFAGLMASAQLPCETVLLVNTNSQDSLKIAAHFADMRGVPPQNVIYLGADESKVEISHDDFTTQIWEPVQRELKARELEGHTLAWIYSAGFPVRINTGAKKMSITGLTHSRNVVPENQKLGNTTDMVYFSPLFRGPGDKPQIPPQGPGSLDRFKAGLKSNMPIPSMMLGFTGKNGNSVDEVLTSLQNGVRSDSTHPKGDIYFVKTKDKPRSFPREWEFLFVRPELEKRGFKASIVTNFPDRAEGVLGLMTGQSNVVPDKLPGFVPGAMAEHMTSFAAAFDQQAQSKCSEWIRAGATATAGTVTEPYSIWWKFPHARFFTYYASGCTMLESFAQSLLNPAQTLCLGEPFARPARVGFKLDLKGLSRFPLTARTTIAAVCQPQISDRPMKYAFFVDGKLVQAESANPLFKIEPADWSDGFHYLCAVAKVDLAVHHGTQGIGGFMINHKNRTPAITGLKELGNQQIEVPFSLSAESAPKMVRLYCGSRLLAASAYPGASLSFNERTIGEGPHTIHVAAVYEDDVEVASVPVPFQIAFAAQPTAE